jgi:hypothetical protein
MLLAEVNSLKKNVLLLIPSWPLEINTSGQSWDLFNRFTPTILKSWDLFNRFPPAILYAFTSQDIDLYVISHIRLNLQ